MLEWNVVIYDINQNKMKVYNVFNHGGFRDDVAKYVKQRKSKEEFSDLVNRALMYYFWNKCEWEILIKPWCGSRNDKEEKVDVYWQVMNNWDHFINYVWNNKKLI